MGTRGSGNRPRRRVSGDPRRCGPTSPPSFVRRSERAWKKYCRSALRAASGPLVFCARATRGRRLPSLDARVGDQAGHSLVKRTSLEEH